MEEKSKILALLNDKTNTTLFLVPALEIPEHILKQMGFVNSFLVDKNKSYNKKDKTIKVVCLFKPRAKAMFASHLEDLDEEGLVLDEYDYPEGHVVVVFKFPERYRKDYELFMQGKYSKFSSEFKKIFPEKNRSYEDGKFDYTLHFHIFKRTPGMREFIEDDLGIEIDREDKSFEYWGIPDSKREELDISNYLKYEYEDQIQSETT